MRDRVRGFIHATAWTNGRSDLFVPHTAFCVIIDYEPGFQTRDDTFYNFLVGFTSGVGISAKGGIIPFRESSGVGDWSVAVDVSGGRRLADPSDFQNYFGILVADVVYNLRKDVTLGFLSAVRVRDYSDYFAETRRDTFVAFQARVELTPKWSRGPKSISQFPISGIRRLCRYCPIAAGRAGLP